MGASISRNIDRRVDALRGMPLYVTGHSIALGFNITPTARWSELLAKKYGLDLTQGSVGGSAIVENSFDMNGDTNFRSYGTPRRGMAIVDGVFNSNSVLGNTTASHTAFKDGLRTILAHLSCSQRQEAQSWTTKSGTWTTLPDSRSSSGSLLYSLTAGEFVETTYVGKDAYVVLFASTTAGANCNVSLDGTNVSFEGSTTIPTLRGVVFNPINYAASNTAMPFAVKVSAATTGTHTVRVTNLQSTFLFVDTLLTINPEAQPVFICQDFTSNPAFSGTTAILTTYNGEAASVAGEFPNAVVVDLNGLTGLTYLYDNTHLDEAGNRKYADFIAPYLVSHALDVGAHVGATQDVSSGVQPDAVDRMIYKYMVKASPTGFTSTLLNNWIGTLTSLTTVANASTVAAINEVNAKREPMTVTLTSLTTAATPAPASSVANVELFATPKTTRVQLDLSRFTQVRIQAMTTVLGSAATAAIKLSYMLTEAATWAGTDAGASVVLGNGTAGTMHDSGWSTLAAAARVDSVTLAALVSVAFGTTAPSISNLVLQFR